MIAIWLRRIDASIAIVVHCKADVERFTYSRWLTAIYVLRIDFGADIYASTRGF